MTGSIRNHLHLLNSPFSSRFPIGPIALQTPLRVSFLLRFSLRLPRIPSPGTTLKIVINSRTSGKKSSRMLPRIPRQAARNSRINLPEVSGFCKWIQPPRWEAGKFIRRRGGPSGVTHYEESPAAVTSGKKGDCVDIFSRKHAFLDSRRGHKKKPDNGIGPEENR